MPAGLLFFSSGLYYVFFAFVLHTASEIKCHCWKEMDAAVHKFRISCGGAGKGAGYPVPAFGRRNSRWPGLWDRRLYPAQAREKSIYSENACND